MIQKIRQTDIEPSNVFSLNVHPGDTIVIEFDQDEWDLDTAQQYVEMLVKNYPGINFLATFKGIEIKGVIHEDCKCY